MLLDAIPSSFIARISSEVKLAVLYFKITDVLAATTSHPYNSIFGGSFCFCVISHVWTDGHLLLSSISPQTEITELPKPTRVHSRLKNKQENYPGAFFLAPYYDKILVFCTLWLQGLTFFIFCVYFVYFIYVFRLLYFQFTTGMSLEPYFHIPLFPHGS